MVFLFNANNLTSSGLKYLLNNQNLTLNNVTISNQLNIGGISISGSDATSGTLLTSNGMGNISLQNFNSMEILTNTSNIDPNIRTTWIEDYNTTSFIGDELPVYTLDDPLMNNVKSIKKLHYGTGNVQIETNKGVFNLDVDKVDLAYFNEWKQSDTPWYPKNQKGDKLTSLNTFPDGNTFFGQSVAVSDDGSILAIGKSNRQTVAGFTGVLVYTRSGSTGSYVYNRNDFLVGFPYNAVISGSDRGQGFNISLNSAGDILAVSGSADNNDTGSTFIFTRTGSTWSQQAKLIGSGTVGGERQGYSVSLNSAGDVLAVGAPFDDEGGPNVGATWIFTRTGSTWSEQTKLIGSGTFGDSQQGRGVSLNSAGDILAVGAPFDNEGGTDVGATWIFTRTGSTWSQQAKLIGTGAIGTNIQQGNSVSLNSVGDILAVGGSGDDEGGTNAGATWIFTRTGSTWTQQAKLIGTGTFGDSRQGQHVSLNSAGDILAVGGPFDDEDGTNVGATWIFTRSGSTWSQQAKLIGTGAIGDSQQGQSVSLNSAGDILAVGGNNDDTIGAAWVFSRSGSTWFQEDKFLPNGVGNAYIGFSMDLSGDGNTLVVGAPLDSSEGNVTGSTFIFTRDEDTMIQQAKLIASSALGSLQGYSVSLSDDGNILAVGARNDDSLKGATLIFTRAGTIWSYITKLVGTGIVGLGSYQGQSVSLNSDGDILAVGGPIDNEGGTNVGATWIFTRSGSTWTQQTKLIGTGTVGLTQQGVSVSLNSAGDILAVGGPFDDEGGTSVGATWIFTRTGSAWTQQAKLIGTGAIGDSQQGTSVSLNSAGDILAVGGPFDNEGGTDVGATWIFTRSGASWMQETKIIGTGIAGSANQGRSVSLNTAGDTLAVGAPGVNATFIFTKRNGIWHQQYSLQGTGGIISATGVSNQGNSVKLSNDGKVLATGSYLDNGGQGAVWIFQ